MAERAPVVRSRAPGFYSVRSNDRPGWQVAEWWVEIWFRTGNEICSGQKGAAGEPAAKSIRGCYGTCATLTNNSALEQSNQSPAGDV